MTDEAIIDYHRGRHYTSVVNPTNHCPSIFNPSNQIFQNRCCIVHSHGRNPTSLGGADCRSGMVEGDRDMNNMEKGAELQKVSHASVVFLSNMIRRSGVDKRVSF